MAYQACVAIDRIRFAIKHTEQFAPQTDQMREAGVQLLDALERLESADRNFQNRFQCASRMSRPMPERSLNLNGQQAKPKSKNAYEVPF